jgi:hypothetical protein
MLKELKNQVFYWDHKQTDQKQLQPIYTHITIRVNKGHKCTYFLNSKGKY